MRICYAMPQSVALVNGGIRTQVNETLEGLKKYDINPVFLNTWKPLNDHEFDIAHIYQASPETLELAKKFKGLGKKLVVSPVFFTRHKASVIRRSMWVESQSKKFYSGIRTDYSTKAEICKLADVVLPNTEAEAFLIEKGFGVDPKKIRVIPNGVESRFAEATPEKFLEIYGIRDFILFAGQAGAPRKGLITLLEAAKDINKELIVIGDLYHDTYGQSCRNIIEAYDNMHHLPTLPHDSPLLESAMAAAKVFVLPSLFETPGIAAMEAALTTANIVITEVGGTTEYFKDYAEYVRPYSITSVKEAVLKAIEKPKSNDLKDHILKHYTWDKVAEKTYEIYKSL